VSKDEELTLTEALMGGILGSTSPLKLDTLRYPTQRWFSLLRVTFRAPHVSCISTKFAWIETLASNTALSSSCKDFTSRAGEKLELLSRTLYL